MASNGVQLLERCNLQLITFLSKELHVHLQTINRKLYTQSRQIWEWGNLDF